MQKILNHIRKQPIHIRKRYVYGAVAVCVAIIVILWIIALGYRLSNVNFKTEVNRQQDAIESLQNERQPIPADPTTLPVEVVPTY